MKEFEGLIKEINNIYKRGYLPSRGKNEYTQKTASMVNCFGHAVFNLQNQDLESILSSKETLLTYQRKFGTVGIKGIMKVVKEKVQEVGLEIQKSSIDEKLEENQWKIAYFYMFSSPYNSADAHFMIQEKDGTWTSKLGVKEEIEVFKKLPEDYHCGYLLQGIYKITNPYIKCEKIDEEME